MEQLTTDQDWLLVQRLLPAGWEQAAKALGAFERSRKLATPAALLRAALLWSGEGLSYQQIATVTAARGDAPLSKEAVGKRLRRSWGWLEWLLQQLLAERLAPPSTTAGRRFVAVDGSSVCTGLAKVQLKLHYLVDLASLRCADLQLTDFRTAEGLQRVRLAPGDVVLCDRYYAKPASLAAAAAQGAEVIARLGRTTLRLSDAAGEPLRLLDWLRSLPDGAPGERPAGFTAPDSGTRISGRVVAVRLSPPQAAKARAAARKAAKKDGREPSPETLEWATYVVLFCTTADLSAAMVLAWYRLRWQIELVFKRLKSLLEGAEIPDLGPPAAVGWLTGKMLYALLLEAYLGEAGAFSPWGWPLSDDAVRLGGHPTGPASHGAGAAGAEPAASTGVAADPLGPAG